MDAPKFTNNLTALLSKDSINNADVMHYVKSLIQLSKEIKIGGRFQTFRPIVKEWIGAFQTLFSEPKIDGNVKIYIRKCCKILTEVFLDLMEIYHQHDPDYHQEFHYHWKSIVSTSSGDRLAKYFCLFDQKFKALIENLRTATHRCEQFATLSVLLLYVEQVQSDQLIKLRENFNGYIIEGLIVLKKKPTILNQHSFLHDIDAFGRTIISIKATQIICQSISLGMTTAMYALWIDFNLRENSITLCGVSPADNNVVLFATLSDPQLTERVAVEHELNIRGIWSIFKRGSNTFHKKTTVIVYLPNGDRNAVWKAKVKSLFSFVTTPFVSSQSISDCASALVDQRLAKLPVDDIRVASVTQVDESFTSLSINGSQIVKTQITPIAPQKLDDDFQHLYNGVATKQWIESTFRPTINKSQFGRTQNSAALIDEQSLQSSGLSFSEEMSFGQCSEYDKDSQRCSSSEHSFSFANEHVQKFLNETDSTSKDELDANKFSTPKKKHSEGSRSVANFIENISPVSIVKPLKQETECKNTNETITRSSSALRLLNSSEGQSIRLNFFDKILPERTSHQITVEKHPSLAALVPSQKSPTKRSAQHSENVVQDTESIQTSKNLNFPKIDQPNEIIRNETNELGTAIQKQRNEDASFEDNDRGYTSVGPEPNDLTLQDDTEGVFDTLNECVFDNDEEMQEAFYIYIENDGLEYLKSESFRAKSPTLRRRYEREFRAIHKILDAKFEASESITVYTRKRKSWNTAPTDDIPHSELSYQSDVSKTSEQLNPLKKRKHSDEAVHNVDDCPVYVPECPRLQVDDDGQPKAYIAKCKDWSHTMLALRAMLDYLKGFVETHEIRGAHQLLLSLVIERMEYVVTMSPTSDGELFSATLSYIKAICREARAYTETILQNAKTN